MTQPEHDLSDLVKTAVLNAMTPELVQARVQEAVDTLVTRGIEDALRTYSDTGKQITSAIAHCLRINDLDLPAYGDTVTRIVKRMIEEHVAEIVAGRMSLDMEEILSLAPKTIKLSEIAEYMLADKDYGDAITVILEGDEGQYSRWLFLDEYSEVQTFACKIRLLIDTEGKIHSGRIHDVELKKPHGYFGKFYSLEQKARAWYACGTVIDLDIDNVITEKQPSY